MGRCFPGNSTIPSSVSRGVYFDSSRQIKEPLEIIYKNDALKKPVEDLINALIEKGSSTFWGLKEVLK
jgi:hypothetical protein